MNYFIVKITNVLNNNVIFKEEVSLKCSEGQRKIYQYVEKKYPEYCNANYRIDIVRKN